MEEGIRKQILDTMKARNYILTYLTPDKATMSFVGGKRKHTVTVFIAENDTHYIVSCSMKEIYNFATKTLSDILDDERFNTIVSDIEKMIEAIENI